MLSFRATSIIFISSLIVIVSGAPIDDDERHITTTNRYYLPTSSSTTSRQYLPDITVRPPRPGSFTSGSKDDSSDVNKNKRPNFEKENRLPHLPAESDAWEKWNKHKNKEDKHDPWSKFDSWNKSPTFLDHDDDDFTYWWFKLPYYYCPPYIRNDPILFKEYWFDNWWPIFSTRYEL